MIISGLHILFSKACWQFAIELVIPSVLAFTTCLSDDILCLQGAFLFDRKHLPAKVELHGQPWAMRQNPVLHVNLLVVDLPVAASAAAAGCFVDFALKPLLPGAQV